MRDQPYVMPFHNLTVFLGVTSLLFFAFPLMKVFALGGMGFKILAIALSIACVYLLSNKGWHTLMALLLAGPGIAMTLSQETFTYSFNEIAGLVSYLSLYVIAIVMMARYMLLKTSVDRHKIAGAICIYLLLGIAWSFIYMIIELLVPNSFNGLYDGAAAKTHSIADVFAHLFYYSYVTLTTLGYGSISPRSVLASAFSSAEAIVGQLYVAIVVARLVSLLTAQELRDRQEK